MKHDDYANLESLIDLRSAAERVLTARQRQVVNLVIHDLSQEEIAKLLGLRNHSVVSRAFRTARDNLIAYVGDGTAAAPVALIIDRDYDSDISNGIRSWLDRLASGELNAFDFMDNRTHAELQKWLAANGDTDLADWFERKDNGWVYVEEDEEIPLYLGWDDGSRTGKFVPDADHQMRKKGNTILYERLTEDQQKKSIKIA